MRELLCFPDWQAAVAASLSSRLTPIPKLLFGTPLRWKTLWCPPASRWNQVHHGYGIACWAVNRRALDSGHGIRTGLEDVTLLPYGTPARDNADLVAAAAHLIRTLVPGFGLHDELR